MLKQKIILRVVDNRVLALGLDDLYRLLMIEFEENKMLPVSRSLMKTLNLEPIDVPIEGYYNWNPKLSEYFTRMRTLQGLSVEHSSKVKDSEEYQFLLRVATSPIYGQKVEGTKFFPEMKDPLFFALENTPVNQWNAETLAGKSYKFAQENNDFSLVGLAALCRDSILITALRESVVLYSGAVALGMPPKYEYVWNVDKEVEEQANRFISVFNELTSSNILSAKAENAEYFFEASKRSDIAGRCVRLAYDDSKIPIQHYHWAINRHNNELTFDEFWKSELWTTKMYKDKRLFLGRFIDKAE